MEIITMTNAIRAAMNDYVVGGISEQELVGYIKLAVTNYETEEAKK